MNKFTAILIDSFQEILSRWIIYALAVIVFIISFIILVTPAIEIEGKNIFESGMLDESTISSISAYFYRGVIDDFFILMLIFGSAWFIPSYLKKGRIELAVSKPIGRTSLLLMKFAAVYLNMIFILGLMSGIIAIVYFLKIGGFSFNFFPGLLLCFFQFLIVYSILFFFGLWSRSGALAIIGYFVIAYMHDLLSVREVVFEFIKSPLWESILDTLYYILPKMEDISSNILAVFKGQGISDFMPLWTSLVFAAVLVLVSLVIFKRRDF